VSNSRFQKRVDRGKKRSPVGRGNALTQHSKPKKHLPSSAPPLRRLIHYGHNYRIQIWQAVACSILNKIFDLAPPALIGAAVDVVVQRQDSLIARLGITDIFTQLLILSLLSFIIWGLESVFEYAYARLWRNLAQLIQHDLRLDAYGHLQSLELAYFEDRSTGGLMSILSDDINQLERLLYFGS
jgi:ATP-binding cassette, subfamily B, bacterial